MERTDIGPGPSSPVYPPIYSLSFLDRLAASSCGDRRQRQTKELSHLVVAPMSSVALWFGAVWIEPPGPGQIDSQTMLESVWTNRLASLYCEIVWIVAIFGKRCKGKR
ncbi:hypothetical protein Ddc_07546 [Ditylenchus destructor]|nr:hypothetical protein Ddc_07546 [Ditylenchus destructor]